MSLPERPKRAYGFDRICSIPDCGGKHSGLGFCKEHYGAFRRQGDPLASPKRARTPVEALALRTVREGDCLIWTGALNDKGYGSAWNGRKSEGAHRLAYRLAFGPIPPGKVIDHVCWNRACVEPSHLRAVPQKSNSRYRSGSNGSVTGYRNITRRPNGKYQVVVKSEGAPHYGGVYENLEDAIRVAASLRERLFGGFAGLG